MIIIDLKDLKKIAEKENAYFEVKTAELRVFTDIIGSMLTTGPRPFNLNKGLRKKYLYQLIHGKWR